MSLHDFARKKRTELREQGPAHALWSTTQELRSKLATPYARHRATPIWAANADVVLVLDGLRYDTWSRVIDVELATKTEPRYSLGSASVEWINETFADRFESSWSRAGYVTGNPHSAKDGGHRWRDVSVYPLKDRGIAYLDEVWRDQWHIDEYETVRPEIMTERGLYAYKNADVDSLVVHYMQPHVPFRSLSETGGWKNTLAFGESDADKKDDWFKLRDGEIPAKDFWCAYRDNLRWVLNEVERWQSIVDGKILVTSDHGNAAGEWGQWGHPPGSGNPALRKVPWVLLEGDGKEMGAINPPGDPPVTEGVGDVDGVNDRLEALGYR